jgi:hypothetical protein
MVFRPVDEAQWRFAPCSTSPVGAGQQSQLAGQTGLGKPGPERVCNDKPSADG